jgi:hypothetical protein
MDRHQVLLLVCHLWSFFEDSSFLMGIPLLDTYLKQLDWVWGFFYSLFKAA